MPVPRCSECKMLRVSKAPLFDDYEDTPVCRINNRSITSKEMELSPSWCPLREERKCVEQ